MKEQIKDVFFGAHCASSQRATPDNDAQYDETRGKLLDATAKIDGRLNELGADLTHGSLNGNFEPEQFAANSFMIHSSKGQRNHPPSRQPSSFDEVFVFTIELFRCSCTYARSVATNCCQLRSSVGITEGSIRR